MIKSIVELIYDARNGEKIAVIEIEVTIWVTNQEGVTYTVNDYAVDANGAKQLIAAKDLYYTNDQLNQMDLLISSTTDFTGLSRTEIEWLKVKKALHYVTQQAPVYGSIANQWVLT